jgi:hypothetical protein
VLDNLLRRLRDERGIALVFALGIMSVLAISSISIITYTSSNSRHAERSEAEQIALALAEAGINNAQSVLGHPDANALNAATLTEPDLNNCPDGGDCFVNVYDGGRTLWRGNFVQDAAGGSWTVESWGLAPSATPGQPDVTRFLRAGVSVVPQPDQPLNATAWNFVIAWKTSDSTTCDMTLYNTAHIDADLYVEGNLCLENSAKVYQPDPAKPVTLIVKGKLKVDQGTQSSKTRVGESSTQPIERAEIAGGCTTSITSAAHPCSWSDYEDRVWASTLVNGNTTSVTRPTSDYSGWYENSNPGPQHPCNPVSAFPTFDNDATQDLTTNGSVGTVDLTPLSSYSCIGRDMNGTKVGELTWDATNKILTVLGAIYIDGSVLIDDNVLIKYQGHASLYLTGTFTMTNGQTRLCAAWTGTNCDFAAWDPNEDMLIVAAHGNDGNGNSVIFSQAVEFQGGLFAENAIDLGQSSRSEGPMIGSTVKIANSVQIKPLPLIDTLPLGAPGNPNTHATPQRPRFSG